MGSLYDIIGRLTESPEEHSPLLPDELYQDQGQSKPLDGKPLLYKLPLLGFPWAQIFPVPCCPVVVHTSTSYSRLTARRGHTQGCFQRSR